MNRKNERRMKIANCEHIEALIFLKSVSNVEELG